MNNNMNYDGYGYPDMNLMNGMFMPSDMMNSNNMMNDISMDMMETDSDLAQPYEGFLKGNMFENLYQQYKNYKPAKLVPNNEQADLLLKVDQMCFAAHEIRLYLDVHPNDMNMIRMFNQYQKQANDAIKTYEKKYGPILANSPSANNTFSWEAYSWPWEMEEI